MRLQRHKAAQLRALPDVAGVYALCDLDGAPIYVGQADASRDTSLRKRVQRHLTSARSDVIANRQVDVWEISAVLAWPVADAAARRHLEAELFHEFDAASRLVNGTVPTRPAERMADRPAPARVEVLPADVRTTRLDPALRFPRQVQHFNALLDYILNTQDKPHLRRALGVHHERLTKYLAQFLATRAEGEA